MGNEMILDVVFFRTEAGNEPVRDWLKELIPDDRRRVGCDIQIVQFRWPLGMPLVRKIDKALWEVRSNLADGCIARVFFHGE
ncbi:type II toxin-antitoxin system RelE/ParE family toxin [Mariprofundus ferrooxydans]|nr:type II toxin-antitoxin system RelE/ParE family toxin [Mariprofundus ferrooxydans]